MPSSARYARGATKCVPEQVDSKLYMGASLVMFSAVSLVGRRAIVRGHNHTASVRDRKFPVYRLRQSDAGTPK